MFRIYLLLLICFLTSCSSFNEAGKILRNEKITTNDEFLVKKKEPLILPPDYKKMPVPGSVLKENNEKEKIKKILKAPKENKKNTNSSSIEESIINQINK
tara:strand:+ start:574 stop:873 length:300 start_codon:yes stop_codon:yes gene_type:complete